MQPHIDAPRQAVMQVESGDEEHLQACAQRAAYFSGQYLPRVTGAAAGSLFAIWGRDWFGVEWTHDSIWFQEVGIRPFTMRSLAGKTVPMWINDPSGDERRKNPKAQTRVRQDNGETQVLIFRRAARPYERKTVLRDGVQTSVPASYPGAPGRIAVNRSRGILRAGDIDQNARIPGQIARGNVGVRWRHPGLNAGRSIVRGLVDAATEAGYPIGEMRYLPAGAAFTGVLYDIISVRI